MRQVEGEEGEALRKLYLQSHEGAYWASFGDFSIFRCATRAWARARGRAGARARLVCE